MKLVAKNISVDSGIIIVADIDYLKSLEFSKQKIKRLGQSFKVENGHYKIHWHLPETYHGELQGDNEIHVTGGQIIVVDPCYVIGTKTNSGWQKWLDDTSYGEKLNTDKAFILDEMGGDGVYRVELDLETYQTSEKEFIKDITK